MIHFLLKFCYFKTPKKVSIALGVWKTYQVCLYEFYISLRIGNEWKIIKNINQLKFYDQHYFKKNWDLRTQIDILRATEDKLSEHTDSYSEISEEITKSEFGKVVRI